MSASFCQIPPNSDIAGIGVRAATYLQACLALFMSFFSVAYRIWRGGVTAFMAAEHDQDSSDALLDELGHVDPTLVSTLGSLESSLFVTSISVLISAIVQARDHSDGGLSTYHGLVVLNLAQLNSFTAFLLFWCRLTFAYTSLSGMAFVRYIMPIMVRNYYLFAVHACITGGLGIWFWSKPSAFQQYVSGPCQPTTFYWIFTPVESQNLGLRIFFLMFFSITVFPPTSWLLPMALIWIQYTALYVAAWIALGAVCVVCSPAIFIGSILYRASPTFRNQVLEIYNAVVNFAPPIPSQKIIRRGGVVASGLWMLPVNLPVIFYIFSTERIIILNRDAVEDGEETEWSYGQTLALITAVVTVAMFTKDFYHVLKSVRASALFMKKAGSHSQRTTLRIRKVATI